MTQFIGALTWQDSQAYKGPVALYTANLATDTQWIYQVTGFYQQKQIQPAGVTIDNINNQQQVSVSFGPVVFIVNQYSRQTFVIPDYCQTVVIQSVGGGALAVNVIFAIDDLSKGDTTNLFAVQNASRGGVLFPVVYKTGNYQIVAADNQTIFLVTCTVVNIGLILPDATAPNVGNGFSVEIWNSSASSGLFLVQVATFGGSGQVINGIGPATPLSLFPGRQMRFVSDGSNWIALPNDSPTYQQQTVNFFMDPFFNDAGHVDFFTPIGSMVMPAQSLNHRGRRITMRNADAANLSRTAATGTDTIISKQTPLPFVDSYASDIVEIIGGVAGQWVLRGLRHFSSAQQAITLGGLIGLVHGMGVTPDFYYCQLICITAELGYTAGDVLNLAGAGIGAMYRLDATSINVRVQAAAINLVNKGTGVSAPITPANWKWAITTWVNN